MNPLIALAIEQSPAIFAGLKAAFAARHPGLPDPTNEEVIAAFNAAFESSLKKDDDWLAAHPE